jgi:hypothetical protein
MSARALADVPVSYPRVVVCLQNELRRAWRATGHSFRRAGVLDEYGAAGDVDDDAADPCGAVGGEEQRCLRDVFGGA